MPKAGPGKRPAAPTEEIQLTVQMTPEGIRAAYARLAQLQQQMRQEARTQAAPRPPIEEVLEELGAQAPEKAWAQLPKDFNEQFDHYVYGLPRR